MAFFSTDDTRAHEKAINKVINYFQGAGFTVTRNEYRDRLPFDIYDIVRNTHDIIEVLEYRSYPDLTVIQNKTGFTYYIDVKTGHALEAFQLVFNTMRLFHEEGWMMAYVFYDIDTEKSRVLNLSGKIFEEIKPMIYYHPERPYHLDFLKENLRVKALHDFPLGHNLGNGRSQDPCVYLQHHVFDELQEFESWVLDWMIFGIKN